MVLNPKMNVIAGLEFELTYCKASFMLFSHYFTEKEEVGNTYTGWNDKIVVLMKTTLQLYFKTFIEKINSSNLIM